MSAKTFIVAVSGGIDSVVLLHTLQDHNSKLKAQNKLVVAHFDHGIRTDSADDAEFVRQLAKQYGLAFECGRAELGERVSEEVARAHRYRFLRSLKDTYNAEAIVTAHHQDDVLETMVISVLRKSGVRAFVGYGANDVLRPFINKSKSEIKAYAEKHALSWREDSTNNDEAYVRNYVRKHIMPKLNPVRSDLLAMRSRLQAVILERDVLSKHLLVQVVASGEIERLKFLPLPYVVQKELIAQWLKLQGVEVSPDMVDRATLAVKLLKPGKKLEITKNTSILSSRSTVLLKVEADSV